MTKEHDIESIVKKLSLKQQLLELIMLDIRYFGKNSSGTYIPVTKLPGSIKDLFKEYPIGGVILFRENLIDLNAILKLTSDLQEHAPFGRIIGVDQEGGITTRITGATDMPGNMALGAINQTEITTKTANIIGTELNALGINLNFAPCVDVNSNSKNPIIGVRSFGHNADLVTAHGTAYIEGLDQKQIITCMKHFPGHGDTATDSHLSETYIHKTAVEIEKCDLRPFQAGIMHDVDMIMTAHIIAPKLDNSQIFSDMLQNKVNTPATLSKVIITTLLRQHLGFRGVIVSDALDMEAIIQNFDSVEATILALTAGVDLIVMPVRIWSNEGIERFISYFDKVYKACSNSPELKQRVEESCIRILKLKHKKVIPKLTTPATLKQKEILVSNVVGSKEHTEFEEKIASQAITLYKNAKKILPWKTTTTDKILIISCNNNMAIHTESTLTELGYTNITVALINEDSIETLVSQIETADKVLVLTYNLTKSDEKLDHVINRLNHFYKPYVMLSCRNPYDILYVKDVNTNVLVYGVSGLDQTNYHIRQFTLNLNQAIIKIFTATQESEFNLHSPVDLTPPKKERSEH